MRMNSYKTDANNRVIFSKDMKIIELIDADYGLLSILLRLDIQLPFGDISVEEMCRRYDMSSELFLTICRIYACHDYEPASESLSAADLPHIVRYLRASHRYYLDTMIPRIDSEVDGVLRTCDRMQTDILRKFYNDYCEEIRTHLQYEETDIFPYVERLAAGEVASPTRMAEYMENHTDICDKIDDIKSIIIKYLPESCSTRQRCDLLFDIFSLRDDLAKHTLVESEILAPLVIAEERRLGI